MFRKVQAYLSVSVPMVLMLALVVPTLLFAEETGKIKPKKQICQEAKAAVPHITPGELQARITAGDEFVLLDIRTRAEYDAGHITGAIWLPRGFLEFNHRPGWLPN